MCIGGGYNAVWRRGVAAASGPAHIRIHQLYRELARVAAPRLPALVDEELFVVEDEAVDTPRVAQRLGHPRVQRQRVAAEEVGLVEDDRSRVLAETVHRLVLESQGVRVVGLEPPLVSGEGENV